jgi:hypothetical protein
MGASEIGVVWENFSHWNGSLRNWRCFDANLGFDGLQNFR